MPQIKCRQGVASSGKFCAARIPSRRALWSARRAPSQPCFARCPSVPSALQSSLRRLSANILLAGYLRLVIHGNERSRSTACIDSHPDALIIAEKRVIMTFPETRLTLIQRLASGGNAEDWQGFFIMPCARRSYEAKRHIFDRNLPGSLSWTGRGTSLSPMAWIGMRLLLPRVPPRRQNRWRSPSMMADLPDLNRMAENRRNNEMRGGESIAVVITLRRDGKTSRQSAMTTLQKPTKLLIRQL